MVSGRLISIGIVGIECYVMEGVKVDIGFEDDTTKAWIYENRFKTLSMFGRIY